MYSIWFRTCVCLSGSYYTGLSWAATCPYLTLLDIFSSLCCWHKILPAKQFRWTCDKRYLTKRPNIPSGALSCTFSNKIQQPKGWGFNDYSFREVHLMPPHADHSSFWQLLLGWPCVEELKWFHCIYNRNTVLASKVLELLSGKGQNANWLVWW